MLFENGRCNLQGVTDERAGRSLIEQSIVPLEPSEQATYWLPLSSVRT